MKLRIYGINRGAKYKAFSLIEILIAFTLFAMIAGSVSIFALDSARFIQNDRQRVSSTLKIKEVANGIILNKSQLWQSIVDNTEDGEKHIQFENNTYTIQDGTAQSDGMTLSFNVAKVYRDTEGNIVTSGGTEDSYTRAINMSAAWEDFLGNPNEVTSTIYVNNWNVQKWSESTDVDFNDGTRIDTYVSLYQDGEVELATEFFPDWCNPSLALTEYDIPGSAYAKSVFGQPGHAFLGTRGAPVGDPFTKLNITGVNPPVVAVEDIFISHRINDIFVVGNYAYLATNTDDKEIIIIDVSSVPYTEVGRVNAPGTANGTTVYVVGNVGYMGQGNIFHTFDASSPIGSRPILDSVTMSIIWFSTVSQVVVRGNYAYVGLNYDWYELGIINVTDPYNISISSQTSVNNQQVQDIYVNQAGTRAYFGTNSSSQEKEIYILNTSNKNVTSPTIASIDSNGMSVRGVSIIEEDSIAIAVGVDAEEYQVYDTSVETAPVKCAGMNINNGINDIDSVIDAEENAFSYIITGDTTQEFKIIRGGEGGGNQQGYGYLSSGNYTSNILDTGSANAYFFALDWEEELQATTDLRIQIRGGNQANLSDATWIGPDGTAATYFTEPSGAQLSTLLNNKRYFQYRAYLTSGDRSYTSRLRSFNLFYEE